MPDLVLVTGAADNVEAPEDAEMLEFAEDAEVCQMSLVLARQ